MNAGQPVPGSNPETTAAVGRSSEPQQTSMQPVPDSTTPEPTAGRPSDPQQPSMDPAQLAVPNPPPLVDTNRSTRPPLTTALGAYPVLESLIQRSHRADIQNLARTNSEVHTALAAGGVSLMSDSALWASCPKLYECFWCGVPLCHNCVHIRSASADEIRGVISTCGSSSTPYLHGFNPLRRILAMERFWSCTHCLNRPWGDWMDSMNILPRCTTCGEPLPSASP